MHTPHDKEEIWRKTKAHVHSLFTPGKLLVGGTIIASIIVGFLFSDQIKTLREPIRAHPYLGVGIFMGALLIITLFPFISSLPLLPVAGAVWGYLLGGIYAAFGWWVGGLMAFWVARKWGRPVLQRYISLKKLDAWEEQIPKDIDFRGIVVARIIFPPSIPSYAVGLMEHISFTRFALASLIGGIPISFLLVALGSAVAAGSFTLVVLIGLSILALIGGSYYPLWRRWQEEH